MGMPPHGEARPAWMDPEPEDDPYAALDIRCGCASCVSPETRQRLEELADLLLTEALEEENE